METFESAFDELNHMNSFCDRISRRFDDGGGIALFEESMSIRQIRKDRMISSLDSDFVLVLCLRLALFDFSVLHQAPFLLL